MCCEKDDDDEKAWLGGQSNANQSKQHRGKAAQWGRHKERVHTRLVRAQGGRENSKTGEHRLFSSPSSRQRQDATSEDAVLEGAKQE